MSDQKSLIKQVNKVASDMRKEIKRKRKVRSKLKRKIDNESKQRTLRTSNEKHEKRKKKLVLLATEIAALQQQLLKAAHVKAKLIGEAENKNFDSKG